MGRLRQLLCLVVVVVCVSSKGISVRATIIVDPTQGFVQGVAAVGQTLKHDEKPVPGVSGGVGFTETAQQFSTDTSASIGSNGEQTEFRLQSTMRNGISGGAGGGSSSFVVYFTSDTSTAFTIKGSSQNSDMYLVLTVTGESGQYGRTSWTNNPPPGMVFNLQPSVSGFAILPPGTYQMSEHIESPNGIADSSVGQMFLTVSDAVFAGDFTGDRIVDAADYVQWRKSDGSPDGYDAWRYSYGNQVASGSSAENSSVPEPATVGLLGLALWIALPTVRRMASR